MRKYWILYRDFGYSEISIYGVTMRADTAMRWREAAFDNEAIECELTRDSLPTKLLS